MTFTLIADGSSDRVLVPLLTWLVKQVKPIPITGQWADFSRIARLRSLKEKVSAALDLYPCDLLFVHRDAEGTQARDRRTEIEVALEATRMSYVAVVPVRMTEAWLFHELAIRAASGNPNGREDLQLPSFDRIESIPDPKQTLHSALRRASGLNTRRVRGLLTHTRVQLIPNYIDDYAHLRHLAAFQELETDVRSTLDIISPDTNSIRRVAE